MQLEPFVADMPDGPVAGRLDAEIQLARLADVAGLDDDRLEGLLDAGLSLAGTLQDPQLDGTVEIIDGIYENGLTGTVLHDMTLRARARQQRLTIEQLSANDGGSGRISGQGFVEIDPAASFPLELTLSLQSARLVQTNEADATLGGQLRLAGTALAASLTGQIEVERADIMIPDQVGPSVPTIQVEEIGGPPGRTNGAAATAGGGSAFDLRLDVVVNLPGRVFVRGRGLEFEWEGRIQAKGSASDPRLTGSAADPPRRLRPARPPLRSSSRRDHLHRKRRRPIRTIDIEAVAQATDITAIVRIGGDAKAPTIALESQPPLPEDEVLSRLMFNRAASSITPLQAVQLAAAVNRLRGGGPGVLDRLRGALGRRHARRRRRRTVPAPRCGRAGTSSDWRLRRGRDRHGRPEQPGAGRGRDPAEPLAPGGHRRRREQRRWPQVAVRLLRSSALDLVRRRRGAAGSGAWRERGSTWRRAPAITGARSIPPSARRSIST